jgi:hypothetical protein
MTNNFIAISVIIISILFVIIVPSYLDYRAYKNHPTPIPIQPKVPLQTTLPQPPVAPKISPTKVCFGGVYCNGTPVPITDATVGAIVCGGGNRQFECVQIDTNKAAWKLLDKPCDDGMKNKCV